MVIGVYVPSSLSHLSSGSMAKIRQSAHAPAERGNKLDGNYGLVFLGFFFRMASKKHGIR